MSLSIISLILALLLSALAAFNVPASPRFNLIAASLFFYFLSLVLAGNLVN